MSHRNPGAWIAKTRVAKILHHCSAIWESPSPRPFGFAQGRLCRRKRDKDGAPSGVEMSERVGSPLLASGSFGVDWTFFERYIHLVAYYGQRFAAGACGKLKDGSGMHANGGQTPGFEVLFNVDDYPLAVKVYGVDRETHGEGGEPGGGGNPKPLPGGEGGGGGALS